MKIMMTKHCIDLDPLDAGPTQAALYRADPHQIVLEKRDVLPDDQNSPDEGCDQNIEVDNSVCYKERRMYPFLCEL